jgi:hypothetical protein
MTVGYDSEAPDDYVLDPMLAEMSQQWYRIKRVGHP